MRDKHAPIATIEVNKIFNFLHGVDLTIRVRRQTKLIVALARRLRLYKRLMPGPGYFSA